MSRRTFIGASALGASALLFPHRLPPMEALGLNASTCRIHSRIVNVRSALPLQRR
ncbi:twin-arginine translocation signal domain-containing protein [Berryella wangjianweii]|uniref:twin-arginine translocation signal domain-containing protein n=1 Tax=Berryella wangjianweii TaxID=2734634 RepID=UPI0036F20BCD